jgi:UDP-2,4-diacetamido-2,4,6-trideoxy-beta-L-altropyranose hydrolase
MDNMKIPLIRADGNTDIGMGHIMRCLALAQRLEKTGIRPVFIVRDYDRKISELVRRYGYDTETIPADGGWNEELRLTSEYAGQYNTGLVITDIGHVGALADKNGYAAYLKGLRDAGKFLVTIDDIIDISFPSNIVINPHYGAENRGYATSAGTRFLLGPAYFIFRSEFIAAAGRGRETKEKASNVLVAIGGSDPLDLTGKVVRALVKSKTTRGLYLHIAPGMVIAESKKLELEKLLKDYPGEYDIIESSDDMAKLMLVSDIIITGGGLTKYEAAVTGTPCVIIPQYDYLVKLAEDFEKTGAALNLGSGGKISDEDITGAVAGLLGDAARRREMSRRGKELVDGRGIDRIIAEIPEEVRS